VPAQQRVGTLDTITGIMPNSGRCRGAYVCKAWNTHSRAPAFQRRPRSLIRRAGRKSSLPTLRGLFIWAAALLLRAYQRLWCLCISPATADDVDIHSWLPARAVLDARSGQGQDQPEAGVHRHNHETSSHFRSMSLPAPMRRWSVSFILPASPHRHDPGSGITGQGKYAGRRTSLAIPGAAAERDSARPERSVYSRLCPPCGPSGGARPARQETRC
jgi:hypothetical protein